MDDRAVLMGPQSVPHHQVAEQLHRAASGRGGYSYGTGALNTNPGKVNRKRTKKQEMENSTTYTVRYIIKAELLRKVYGAET